MEFPEDEDINGVPSKHPIPSKRLQQHPILLTHILLGVVLLTLALVGTIDLTQRGYDNFARHEVDCSCGDSPSGSPTGDCQFDEILLRWSNPQCVDRELLEEFRNAGPGGNWTYFQHEDGTGAIEASAMATQIEQHPIWVTHEYHVLHCYFIWRMRFRTQAGGIPRRPLPHYMDSKQFIIDCGRAILDETKLDKIDTFLPVSSSIL